MKKDKEGVTLGKSKCRCGSTAFETVNITPVGIVDKREFTRCSICGLVIIGFQDDLSEKKSKSKTSLLHLVRNALERDK